MAEREQGLQLLDRQTLAKQLHKPVGTEPFDLTACKLTSCLPAERAQRLLQLDRQTLAEQLHDPASGAPFVLISARPQSFEARWGYLLDYLTRDQWSLQGVDR